MTYQQIKSAIGVIDVAMAEDRLTADQANRMLATIDGATQNDIYVLLRNENLEALRSATRAERRRKNRDRSRRTSR